MSKINKHDTNGVKGILDKGEFGYDDYSAGGDAGRVYIGDGTSNIPLAKKSEVDANAANISSNTSELSLKAPLASPALTGTPTATTATAGDDSTRIATTAFVQNEISLGSLSTTAISKTTNGYMHLSNGLILQWGTTASNVPSNGSLAVTFPLTFPNGCLNASATTTDTGGTDVPFTIDTASLSTTGMTIYNTSGAAVYNNETAAPAMWFAIGH